MSVSQLVELSGLSKSYISHVKHGRRPPSQKLLDALSKKYQQQPSKQGKDYLTPFLKSREATGVSRSTLGYYKERLSKFINNVDYLNASRQNIQSYLNSIPANQYGLGTRHASYRAIRAFYSWLNIEYGFTNSIANMPAPILGKPILPSLSREQVHTLLEVVESIRDKAIIALFTESGLRLSELANIRLYDIDWDNRTIRIMGKGRKEALATFGELSERYLKAWLAEYEPNGNIWGINPWGIASMLRRLESATGLPCNPHTFRSTFTCLLRKAGIDTMTIKDLGRWESLEIVQRYTRSVTFEDSLKFYKAPLS